MRITLLLSLAATTTAVLAGFGPDAQAQSMMDQMILSRCASAMNADFQKAGKTPAPGSVQKTCSCVVKKISETHNIDLAKQICTQQAMQGD